MTEKQFHPSAHKRTPTGPRYHGSEAIRGLSVVPQSPFYEGRFGRMFRTLPAMLAEDGDLIDLSETMFENPTHSWHSGDNREIPAGFTYLGQFIDHDITFDPTSKLQRDNDPNGLKNFRTPRFDLDSIYGSGPEASPYLYDGIRLLIGRNEADEEDLPRNMPASGGRRALIGDPRNDENVIISQLQIAFLKYHNRVVDALEDEGSLSHEEIFDVARQIVRWHYQWIVVHEFLDKTVGGAVIDDILRSEHYTIHTAQGPQQAYCSKVDLKFYGWENNPFMPVEFAVAAYRFGHSQVRPSYNLNDDTTNVPIFADTRDGLDLRSFRERPGGLEIQWRRFYEFAESGRDLQFSRLIDTKLAHGLKILPFAPDLPSLAARNLLRSKALGLPSGQAVARAMGIPTEFVLKGDALELRGSLADAFSEDAPLWFYILKEAETLANGQRLGPVGGRIVAEVFIGLLLGDPSSYLRADPAWKPQAGHFGCHTDGSFGMADLLRYAEVTI